MTTLTIGQVARQSGTSVEALRYYEREGLLPRPARSAAGYRLYAESVLQRVRFIQRAKQVGFTLREIEELLSLRADPHTTCAQVKQRADRKVADIDVRIRELQAMRAALLTLARQCPDAGAGSDCPILDALNQEEIAPS
ncbi:MAG: heavy metal-responsive transcriptional regulator [Gammaproteobacteria bacterium]